MLVAVLGVNNIAAEVVSGLIMLFRSQSLLTNDPLKSISCTYYRDNPASLSL